MPENNFSELIKNTCKILQVDHTCDNDQEAYMTLQGFEVGMLLDTKLNPSPLRCYFDLGEVAETDSADVWRRLLTANLQIGSVGYGVFGWHEESKRPMLVILLPDANAVDSHSLAQYLEDCAAQCREWRDELILARGGIPAAVGNNDHIPPTSGGNGFGMVQYG
jgi:hypothetical protein